jgi:hypothetical protein
MFETLFRAVGSLGSLAKAHPVISGIGLGALLLPKLFGAGGSPEALMGAQSAIGGQMPPGGMPPGAMPPAAPTGAPTESPGSF